MYCQRYLKTELLSNSGDSILGRKLPIDKNLISNLDTKIMDLEELTKESCLNGRIDIKYNNSVFKSFFFGKGCRTLYVLLNGARPIGSSPAFKRWSWYPLFDGDVINIDDPMYDDYKKITLGWYWGNREKSYRHDVVKIVEKLVLEFQYEDVVFYSSSGGGTAAVHCAKMFPNSTAIVLNPQIFVSEYEYASKFQEITGVSFSEEDKLFRRIDLLEGISNCNSTFIFIENRLSKTDAKQSQLLLEYFNQTEYTIGLNRVADNVLLWMYEAPGIHPHDSQEWGAMLGPILYLKKLFKNNCDISQYKEYYSFFSRLWYERYLTIENNAGVERQIYIESNDTNFWGKMNCVFDSEKITLLGSQDNYAHITIPFDLLPNKTYFFQVSDYSIGSNEAMDAYFAIKDEMYNKIVYQHELDGKYAVRFRTGSDTQKIELRVYPGKIGYCANKEITLYGIILLEV